MINKVKNLNELNAIVNKIDGENIYVEEEQKIYQYKNNEWEEQKPGDVINSGVSVYELNQNLNDQLERLNEYELTAKEEIIRKFVKDKANNYYMLLCNELHYYTIFITGKTFKQLETGPIQREITNCLFHMGEIKSIELTEDKNAVEIWLTLDEGNSHVFYFFPYDMGVIECE